jgi:hypothetical protein
VTSSDGNGKDEMEDEFSGGGGVPLQGQAPESLLPSSAMTSPPVALVRNVPAMPMHFAHTTCCPICDGHERKT